MRIISGRFKGRTIQVPRGFSGRPTTDFAREGLFNILSSIIDWPEKEVLDLFSGTGAFSLECFSRGASAVVAIEKSPVHSASIRDNFRNFDLINGQVIPKDVLTWLKSPTGQYDLIFADPPFDLPELPLLPGLVLSSGTLRAGGWFVLEHPKSIEFGEKPHFQRHRSFGNVHFSLFRT